MEHAFVHPPVVEAVFSVAVFVVIFVGSFIDFSLEFVNPNSMSDPIFKLAWVDCSIFPNINSDAIWNPMDKLPFIGIWVLKYLLTFTMFGVIAKLASILMAFFWNVLSNTFKTALIKVAYIPFSTDSAPLALPVLKIIAPLPRIDFSIGPFVGSCSVFHVGEVFALVVSSVGVYFQAEGVFLVILEIAVIYSAGLHNDDSLALLYAGELLANVEAVFVFFNFEGVFADDILELECNRRVLVEDGLVLVDNEYWWFLNLNLAVFDIKYFELF